MEATIGKSWHAALADPSGKRPEKPRLYGKTMVIDKGLGLRAFADLLETANHHIDIIKLGFGTSALYPQPVLEQKIRLARSYDVCIMPGGTFLEIAVVKGVVKSYFRTVSELGFTGVEISDGTINLDRKQRDDLIQRGMDHDLKVFSEFGKKLSGSAFELDLLEETVYADVENGVEHVTIEGRESGKNVGIYDESGNCRDDYVKEIARRIPDRRLILWEAPLKSQQTHLLKLLGADIHLGNILPEDVLSVEALRRGLRADTMKTGAELYDYVI